MTIVDTSVWIDHFRSGNNALTEMLTSQSVLMHPFVFGELACGGLRNRTQVLADLNTLPMVPTATHDEALRLIEKRRLWGKGIGWVDSHLLASALISDCVVWTLDKQLANIAEALGVGLNRG